MKKSIIYLGIALLTISNVITALAQQSFIKGDSLAQTVTPKTSLAGHGQSNRAIEKNNSVIGENSVSIDPETIITANYQKTMEEIIAENNQIIESSISTEESNVEENQINITIEANPVYIENAMEDIIQDSQIIESPVLNAIQPSTLKKNKQ